MFQALFNLIIVLLATIIQIIVFPINVIIESLLPDLTTSISQVSVAIDQAFGYISYAWSQIPTTMQLAILVAVGYHLFVMLANRATYVIPIVWKIIQKVKFW